MCVFRVVFVLVCNGISTSGLDVREIIQPSMTLQSELSTGIAMEDRRGSSFSRQRL